MRRLTAALFLLALPALAGRGLDEPPGIARVLKGSKQVEEALLAAGVSERCSDAVKTADLLGIECRATAAGVIMRKRPLDKPADVAARAALFADLASGARSVSAWAPLSPPPGLARARFDAHRALSAALMVTLDDVTSARARVAAADAWLKLTPAPKETACQAAQRSLDLGVGADASLEERGAAQSLLTSHRCFLDESRLNVAPRPGLALKDSSDANRVAASTSSTGAIQAYAQSRSMDIERCHKHLDAGGRPTDRAKLEQCACGAIARWKLPAPKQPLTTELAIAGAVAVVVEVAANGAVARCGPLTPAVP